jgi:hypothetical protein
VVTFEDESPHTTPGEQEGGGQTAAGLAEMILRMLGVPPDDARDIARRPLPDLA